MVGLHVLNGLGSLVEQSLLRKEDEPGGEPRFLMLATVREYALEQLAAAGEDAAVRNAHAAHFLALAEDARREFGSPTGAAWMDRLEREHDNLRSALGWLVHAGEAEHALRLAGALWWFWWVRAYLGEGRDWLRRALATGGGSVPVRARALEGLGMLHTASGEHAVAIQILEEAVALRRQTGDRRRLMTALSFLGNALALSDPERAYAIHTDVLVFQRASGNQRGVAGALINLGLTALVRDDAAEAARLLEQVVTVQPPVVDGYRLALSYVYLAWAAIVQGEYDRAALWLRKGAPYVRYFQRVSLVFLVAAVPAPAGSRAIDAVRLFAAADATAGRMSGLRFPGTAYASVRAERLRELRATLDEDAFAAAWAEGQALSFDAALALALTALDEAAVVESTAMNRDQGSS